MRRRNAERGIWQRRYWEHTIRDGRDLATHVNYVHFNPVKHGWVKHVADWPYSTFHRYVDDRLLLHDWAGPANELIVPVAGALPENA